MDSTATSAERRDPVDESVAPSDLPGRRWWRVLKRTVNEFQDDNLTDWAAALTYYAVLSLFPALIVLVALVGLFGDPVTTTQDIANIVRQVTGSEKTAETFSTTVKDVIEQRGGAGALLGIGLVAAIMELTNEVSRLRETASPGALRFALETASSLLMPFAPHTAADAYHHLTGRRVWEEPWPEADPALLERDTVEIVLQVNGKVRDRVQAPADATEEDLKALAREAPNVRTHLDGKEIVKEVVVPGKLVNLVVR